MKTVDFIKTLEEIGAPFFSIADLEKITGLKRASLYVALNRWVKMGVLERVSQGGYRLYNAPFTVEKIAAALYFPNYLSFEWALARYGLLNQIPITITFATSRKTKRLTVSGKDVEFRHIQPAMFWGYDLKDGLYIAKPEKALLDQLYFVSLGKASLDEEELNLREIPRGRFISYAKQFPPSTQKLAYRLIAPGD
ncbi:MAG TPA: hypothetical protein EYP53_08475 [Candidatus Latescibacteria bacterium]|nr:hypothetical protein [Candidatus Latescibacterota bacterium]